MVRLAFSLSLAAQVSAGPAHLIDVFTRQHLRTHILFSVCLSGLERSRAEVFFVRSYLFFVPFLESVFTSPADRRSSPLSHVSACWVTLVYLAAFSLPVWHCLVSLICSANGVHKTASQPKLGENIMFFPKFSSWAQNHVWSESQIVTEGIQRKIPQFVCIPMFLLIQPYPGNTS